MPTYEYRCRSCMHEFERSQKITEAPIRQCPKCRRRAVERLISGGTFLLKGGGWYKDGYGAAKPATPAKSAEPAKSPAAGETKKTAQGSGG